MKAYSILAHNFHINDSFNWYPFTRLDRARWSVVTAPYYIFCTYNHLPGPGGQPYFYNTQTRESTYIRPIPVQTTTKKKERPLVKTPIPGTEWLRVITSEGNTFYSHKLRKESVWAIPEEIRSAVEGLQTEERGQQPTQDSISVNSKRKVELPLVGDETVVNKRARINDDDDDDDEETSEDDWQRQAAEQLATEAEEERKRVEVEMEKEKEEEVQRVRAAAEIIMPQKVDLSIEEGKALFKVSPCSLINSQKSDQDLDSIKREGHKSVASLGYVSPKICLRSALCTLTLRGGATRSF